MVCGRNPSPSEDSKSLTNRIQSPGLWLGDGSSFSFGRSRNYPQPKSPRIASAPMLLGPAPSRRVNLLAQRGQQRRLRLQSLQLAKCGAGFFVHPIRQVEANFFDRFLDRFRICGFLLQPANFASVLLGMLQQRLLAARPKPSLPTLPRDRFPSPAASVGLDLKLRGL